MTTEEWADIPGYEGTYKVSSHGQVWSAPRNGTRRGGSYLKHASDKSGYLFVNLYRGGKYRSRKVHALVLLAFVGPCPDGLEVLHADGDPANVHLSNLSYGTTSENVLDQVKHGTHHHARKTHCPHGHPYSGSNLYIAPARPRRRICRACRNKQNRTRYRAKTREGL